MIVRMASNNASCWKRGEVFKCHEMDGKVYINCHHNGGTKHFLLSIDNEELTPDQVHQCPEVEFVQDGE